MINLGQSSLYQDSLGYLGQQMDFPEKMTFHPKIFEETISKSHPNYEDLLAYRGVVMSYTLLEIKAIYTDASDFSKKHPLYMTFNEFGTQKGRDRAPAELRVLYEMFRLKTVNNGLSDFLPLTLQFSQVADFKSDSRTQGNLRLVIMITEDGTYEMANTLAENNNPYAYVVGTLRKALKACIVPLKEVENHA